METGRGSGGERDPARCVEEAETEVEAEAEARTGIEEEVEGAGWPVSEVDSRVRLPASAADTAFPVPNIPPNEPGRNVYVRERET